MSFWRIFLVLCATVENRDFGYRSSNPPAFGYSTLRTILLRERLCRIPGILLPMYCLAQRVRRYNTHIHVYSKDTGSFLFPFNSGLFGPPCPIYVPSLLLSVQFLPMKVDMLCSAYTSQILQSVIYCSSIVVVQNNTKRQRPKGFCPSST